MKFCPFGEDVKALIGNFIVYAHSPPSTKDSWTLIVASRSPSYTQETVERSPHSKQLHIMMLFQRFTLNI